jgi:hypothetical protein
MREIFDVMFVLCFVLPPTAVFAGVVALAWPRHVRKASGVASGFSRTVQT